VAKKDRVPTPPKRPVQAPKTYKSEGNPRRTQWIFIGVAALIIVVAAAIGIGFIMSSGGDSGGGGGINAAGCTFKTFDALEAGHVDELPDGYEYNSIPATSGLHNPTTAIWNLYDQPVPEINYVHNLEHGAVGMFYGPDVPEETVAQMQEFYNKDPRGLIMAPDDRLGDQIALTAWTHIAKGKTFDEEVFETFVDEFGFRGPESCKNDIEQGCFRRENLEPGNQ
jgi:hypothetical protein